MESNNNLKPSVLYVDDDVNNLNSFKLLFRRDYNITIASSGYEGLDLLKNKKIQVVISDQRMPEMNGVEFLEQVSNLYPDTFRFILSGYADYSALKDGINKAKISGFFSKPLIESELKRQINNSLEIDTLRYENQRLFVDLTYSEDKYRNTFELAPVGIAHVHLDGSFSEVNQQFCNIIGYTKQELSSQNINSIISMPNTDYNSYKLKQVILEEEKQIVFDQKVYHKTGIEIWLNITLSKLSKL
ncbi:MAG: response regulator, partial [Okeania sp. SIO3B3]|nr:response regulator [Okeania sp. SIO3B3]